MIEKIVDKKVANRISYQIWYKRCLKGKFGWGPKSAKEGPHPQVDMDGGGDPYLLADFEWGPNARGVQIRCDTGTALSFRRDFLWSVV